MSEQANTLVLKAARDLAKAHPGLSVCVTLCASIYHTPNMCPDITQWSVTVGHRDTESGSTLAECVAKIEAQYSPETKLAKIADLRRQATELEAELNPPPQ